MNKLHVKNPDTQPVICKQYGFYSYASTYKGNLPQTSFNQPHFLLSFQFCLVKVFFLPVTHFYGLSKDVGSDEAVNFKRWDF